MTTASLEEEDARFAAIILLGVSALTGGGREWDDFLQRHVEFYTGGPADSLVIGERVRQIAATLWSQLDGGEPDPNHG
ncbi:MAG TPA: hypothetical protein VNB24_07595 [Acidimicrobiales bacterium]|nr:hypothetical protein [Acidimicrobiales bacterium]